MEEFSLVTVAKKLRAAGYMRADIAEVFGLDASGISRITKGYDVEASYYRVRHIASQLGISIDEVDRMGTDPDYLPPLDLHPGFPVASGRLLATA